jgi:hypothetical protein
MKNSLLLVLLALYLPSACGQPIDAKGSVESPTTSNAFGDYWYQGKAEISSYKLSQARYGEMREGHAVMVFVTEDFSHKKQVKLDRPQQTPEDVAKVLKLNLTKKFNTGIYPYSMMQSVFTPVDRSRSPHSLKVTTSSQEWCGHTFTQLNLKSSGFEHRGYSYFESEGDINTKLDKVLLEDELWNLIRINPKLLPTGEVNIIPATMTHRLRHTKLESQKASIDLSSNETETIYEINYPDRQLKIIFETEFPHKILGWDETYRDGFGTSAQTLTTKARLDKTIMSAYWTKNSNADASLRKELNLD